MSYDLTALREREFPWAARGDAIYLNNASTGPVPTRSFEQVDDFWNARNVKDAADTADDAAEHADHIEDAADGKDFTK